MSMVDTWSIWIATVSFIRASAFDGQSVKPAAQFPQQVRSALAQRGIALATLDIEEPAESRDGGTALVQPGVDLARLEQECRTIRCDCQHAVQRTRRPRPVALLGKPQADVVLKPEEHVAVGHRIEVVRLQL